MALLLDAQWTRGASRRPLRTASACVYVQERKVAWLTAERRIRWLEHELAGPPPQDAHASPPTCRRKGFKNAPGTHWGFTSLAKPLGNWSNGTTRAPQTLPPHDQRGPNAPACHPERGRMPESKDPYAPAGSWSKRHQHFAPPGPLPRAMPCNPPAARRPMTPSSFPPGNKAISSAEQNGFCQGTTHVFLSIPRVEPVEHGGNGSAVRRSLVIPPQR